MSEENFERDTGLYMPNDDGVLESIRTDEELQLGLWFTSLAISGFIALAWFFVWLILL